MIKKFSINKLSDCWKGIQTMAKCRIDSIAKSVTCNLLGFLMLCIFNLQLNAQSSYFNWAKGFTGVRADYCLKMVTDKSNNLYITGFFTSPDLTFDSITIVGYSGWNAPQNATYIAKFNSTGNVLWAQSIVSSDDGVKTVDVAVDDSGFVYVTGNYYGAQLAIDTIILSNPSYVGTAMYFWAKFDNNGHVIWAKQQQNFPFWTYLLTSKDGFVYTYGSFYKPFVVGNDSLFTLVGKNNTFLIKNDGSGNPVWARCASSFENTPSSAVTDTNGNIFICGNYKAAQLIFDTIVYNNSLTNSYDFFIVKYNSSGNVRWVKSGSHSGNDEGQAITCDQNGNVFVSGTFGPGPLNLDTFSLLNTNTNISELFIFKLDSTGNVIIGKQTKNKFIGAVSDLKCDQQGNLFLGGHFLQVLLKVDSLALAGAGSYTPLVIKFDSLLNVQWGKCTNGPSTLAYLNSISVDSIGRVFLAGDFHHPVENFGLITLNQTPNYIQLSDIFLAQLEPCIPTYQNVSDTSCLSFVFNNHVYTSSGIYSDLIYNPYGCDTIAILDLTIHAVDTSITVSGSTLVANASGANYQWLDCNNNFNMITGATNQMFSPSTAGNYAASITQSGCTDTSGCFSLTNTGNSELSDNGLIISVISSDIVVINMPERSNESAFVSIYDFTGKMIRKLKINSTTSLHNLPTGVYLVKCIYYNKLFSEKFVIFK